MEMIKRGRYQTGHPGRESGDVAGEEQAYHRVVVVRGFHPACTDRTRGPRYEVITPLTLGLLDKAVSYKIHVLLWGPFLILVVLHVYLNTSPMKRL
jgi:hypothetical protein